MMHQLDNTRCDHTQLDDTRVARYGGQSAAARSRRGLSLLEVLISMGILLVGLAGIAAMIPAGRSELLSASKIDYAAVVGRAAFRDLQIRGYLNVADWFDADNNRIYQPDESMFPGQPYVIRGVRSAIPPLAVALDPLGCTAPTTFTATFPFGAASGPTMLRVIPSRIDANPAITHALADIVFRSSDDLTLTPGTRDVPPTQRLLSSVRRASEGNYSWLATITTEPTTAGLATESTISVAVFHKRDMTPTSSSPSERAVCRVNLQGVAFEVGPTTPHRGVSWAQEALLVSPAKPMKPGQWMMLAGSIGGFDRFGWYRVIAADQIAGGNQFVTLAGSSDWRVLPTLEDANANPTFAWAFDGIINVTEKQIPLD